MLKFGFPTFLITLILDQISKIWVVQWLNLREVGTIEVFPPLLVFRMAWNRGINFGLFAGNDDASRWILIGLAVVIVLLVFWWVRRESDWKVFVSTGVLIGGALGNVIDRIVYGAVADFLNMSCCGINNPFSFNIADIAIFIGAIGLMIWAGNEKPA